MTTIRFDPNMQITWRGVVSAARDFFAWWRGQLWDLAPASWRRRAFALSAGWTIAFEEEKWRLRAQGSDKDDLLLDPEASDEDLRSSLVRIDPAYAARRFDAIVPQEQGLSRVVRLPAAADQRLHSVIALQLARLSPLRTDDVSFAFRRLGPATDGEIEVEVWIVPKQALQAYEQRLARLDVSVRCFFLSGLPLEFSAVDRRRTPHETLRYALGAVAALACLGAVLLAPVTRAIEHDHVSAEVEKLRQPANQAVALRDELRRLNAPLTAAAAKRLHPNALDTLRILTRLSPDDLQLSELKIDGGRIRIAGSCRDAVRFISMLRKSGRFSHVAPSAPAGRTQDGRDRFEIEMIAAPRPRAEGAAP